MGVALALCVLPATAAYADIVIDGPIDLGSADTYGVLGFSTVTNTGPTVVTGDVGLYSGTSITGFPPGVVVGGAMHLTDAHAQQAQIDNTTAYNVAASLTPTATSPVELAGESLTPGVYSGGALLLSDNGVLTLDGSAASVWVFQASSSLTIGSATSIVMTGGASPCNVFWQVGSSATLGTTADFVGTILALESITATTNATVAGRLFAQTGAVTLDSNIITAPLSCPPAGVVTDTTPPVVTAPVVPPVTPAATGGVGATDQQQMLAATGSEATPLVGLAALTIAAGLGLLTLQRLRARLGLRTSHSRAE